MTRARTRHAPVRPTPEDPVQRLPHALTALVLTVLARLPDRGRADGDRGDVPGWVLITVMTAALVVIIWTAADDQITGLLENVLDGVAPAGGG